MDSSSIWSSSSDPERTMLSSGDLRMPRHHRFEQELDEQAISDQTLYNPIFRKYLSGPTVDFQTEYFRTIPNHSL